MTNGFYDCLKTLFGCAWSLLTGVYLPGTNITPAAMLLFGALAAIAIKFLVNIYGVGSIYHSINLHEGKPEKPQVNAFDPMKSKYQYPARR